MDFEEMNAVLGADFAERPLVIYHSPCLDGFTAAWACWLKHPEAEFVPGIYGQDPPDVAGRDVFLLDFSYKRDVMLKIIDAAKSVVVLDHHKTAEAELANIWGATKRSFCHFDMNKSGARLAWEWFHPNEDVPLLVKLVEDRDLWRFNIGNSKEINAALFSYEYDFGMWSNLRSSLESARGYDNLLNAGRAIERKQDKDVKELVAGLRHDRYFDAAGALSAYGPIPCANLPYTLASDAGNLMAEGAPFSAVYYQEADGWFKVRLCSKEDGADVSAVAARYGGGGHEHAAGFRVRSLEDL